MQIPPEDEGYNAYHEGIARKKNPHPANTWQREEWFEGWDRAEGEEKAA